MASLEESIDGRVAVTVGLSFDAPYRTTTEHIYAALQAATDGDGNLVLDGGAVSIYGVVLNSATALRKLKMNVRQRYKNKSIQPHPLLKIEQFSTFYMRR